MLTIREVIKKIVVKQIIILIMMIIIRVLHWVLQSRYWPPQNGFRCCRNHNVISIESIFDGDSPQYQRSIRVLNRNLQLQSGPRHNILLCCQNRYET
jgi:hypothetical protein